MAPYYKQLMTYAPGPVPDWKLRLKRAWSPRFVTLLGAGQAVNAVWPNFGGIVDPLVFNVVSCVLAVLALIAIFTKQEGFRYGK
ncbi:MAG: hypothetical protein EOR11_20065 [Mesorhizobium sp.]|uniref:DUF7940 domain-containing protein n=1 Tax=Mesorhizobium sp. TaxID=1871066 RepID=UPI000FE457FC|nr:hypothetical protein [Mesorhizobium sp.]RWP84758.1 MAG: hypothetical protein EOR11_20065 [Mesorhizobium sp.]